MKSRGPRGSTLLVALGATIVLALIIAGVLAFSGDELERSSRSMRDLDAQDCAESGAQWGRKFYGDHYPQWNTYLGPTSGYSNPDGVRPDQWASWGPGSYGRMDGQPVDAQHLPDFRVTISDNVDEFPVANADPYHDSDMQVILRAECINPRYTAVVRGMSAVPAPTVTTDPYGWHGTNVRNETVETRRNKVISVTLISTWSCEYDHQNGAGCDGSNNVGGSY